MGNDFVPSNDTCSNTVKLFRLLEPEVRGTLALLKRQNISPARLREKYPHIALYADDEDIENLMRAHETDWNGNHKKFGVIQFIAQMLEKHSGVDAPTLERYQRHKGSRQKKGQRSSSHPDKSAR